MSWKAAISVLLLDCPRCGAKRFTFIGLQNHSCPRAETKALTPEEIGRAIATKIQQSEQRELHEKITHR